MNREIDLLKSNISTIESELSLKSLTVNEITAKYEQSHSDYQRYFDENSRLKDLIRQLKVDKESAQSEITRIKSQYIQQIENLTDESSKKIAMLQTQIQEDNEEKKTIESQDYRIIRK